MQQRLAAKQPRPVWRKPDGEDADRQGILDPYALAEVCLRQVVSLTVFFQNGVHGIPWGAPWGRPLGAWGSMGEAIFLACARLVSVASVIDISVIIALTGSSLSVAPPPLLRRRLHPHLILITVAAILATILGIMVVPRDRLACEHSSL